MKLNGPFLLGLVANKGDVGKIFKNVVFNIYSGAQPENSSESPTGTLLATSYNMKKLTFLDKLKGIIRHRERVRISNIVPGVFIISSVKVVVIRTGMAGYMRISDINDDNRTGSYFPRIDLTVGTSGCDVNLYDCDLIMGMGMEISFEEKIVDFKNLYENLVMFSTEVKYPV